MVVYIRSVLNPTTTVQSRDPCQALIKLDRVGNVAVIHTVVLELIHLVTCLRIANLVGLISYGGWWLNRLNKAVSLNCQGVRDRGSHIVDTRSNHIDRIHAGIRIIIALPLHGSAAQLSHEGRLHRCIAMRVRQSAIIIAVVEFGDFVACRRIAYQIDLVLCTCGRGRYGLRYAVWIDIDCVVNPGGEARLVGSIRSDWVDTSVDIIRIVAPNKSARLLCVRPRCHDSDIVVPMIGQRAQFLIGVAE